MINKKAVQEIKFREWQQWGTRRLAVRLAECWIMCPSHFDKIFGYKFPDTYVIVENYKGQGFIDKKQFDIFLKKTEIELISKGFKNFYEKKAIKIYSIFLNFCKKINQTNLKKLSNKRLIEIFQKFIYLEDDFTSTLWLIFLCDFFLPELFQKEIKTYLFKIGKIEKLSEFNSVMTSPEKMAEVIVQELNILKSAMNIKRGGNLEKEAILLQKKYGYFTILNLDEQPLSVDYFKKEISKNLKNKESFVSNLIKIKTKSIIEGNKKYSRLIKLIKNKRIKNITEATRKVAFYREYRNEIRRQGYNLIQPLYLEIGRRLGKEISQTVMLTRSEVVRGLSGKTADTADRKNFLLANLNKKEYIFEGNEFDKIKNTFVKKIVSVTEFHGVSATKGKAIGKACIILDVFTDAKKFYNKDVLVTSMTNVDFVGMMGKSSAIITDEGSILCHAAIISRELKKPCIVGTKIATKVLKDGDLVEVDANKGIVRIIKKANK